MTENIIDPVKYLNDPWPVCTDTTGQDKVIVGIIIIRTRPPHPPSISPPTLTSLSVIKNWSTSINNHVWRTVRDEPLNCSSIIYSFWGGGRNHYRSYDNRLCPVCVLWYRVLIIIIKYDTRGSFNYKLLLHPPTTLCENVFYRLTRIVCFHLQWPLLFILLDQRSLSIQPSNWTRVGRTVKGSFYRV